MTLEEGEGKCKECKQVDILDSTLEICFDCWCVLDLKEQEKSSAEENDDGHVDELEETIV
jgi:hypothetical protein